MSLRPTPGPYLADGAHRGWSRAQPGADGPREASSLQSRPHPSPLTVLPWILALLHSITSESLQTGPRWRGPACRPQPRAPGRGCDLLLLSGHAASRPLPSAGLRASTASPRVPVPPLLGVLPDTRGHG